MTTPDPAGLNETFRILAHSHRRYALYHLTTESEVVDVATLASAITEWEREQTETGASTDPRTVETALRHTHLPKLEDAGIVTLGPDGTTVELTGVDGLNTFLVRTAHIDGFRQTAAGY